MNNLQSSLDNHVKAKRQEEMLNSEQLTVGELILKLESVSGDKPVVFDGGEEKPTGLGSWRGSYEELAIRYEGSNKAYEKPTDDCQLDQFGYHSYKCDCDREEYKTNLPEEVTANDLLRVLNLIKGKQFRGYKGGDYTMGKTTPVWVANYGYSSGFNDGDSYKYSQAVVDVKEDDGGVSIVTKLKQY
jgi:hypothetical protein